MVSPSIPPLVADWSPAQEFILIDSANCVYIRKSEVEMIKPVLFMSSDNEHKFVIEFWMKSGECYNSESFTTSTGASNSELSKKYVMETMKLIGDIHSEKIYGI